MFAPMFVLFWIVSAPFRQTDPTVLQVVPVVLAVLVITPAIVISLLRLASLIWAVLIKETLLRALVGLVELVVLQLDAFRLVDHLYAQAEAEVTRATV